MASRKSPSSKRRLQGLPLKSLERRGRNNGGPQCQFADKQHQIMANRKTSAIQTKKPIKCTRSEPRPENGYFSKDKHYERASRRPVPQNEHEVGCMRLSQGNVDSHAWGFHDCDGMKFVDPKFGGAVDSLFSRPAPSMPPPLRALVPTSAPPLPAPAYNTTTLRDPDPFAARPGGSPMSSFCGESFGVQDEGGCLSSPPNSSIKKTLLGKSSSLVMGLVRQ